jgi:hypothetical protein
VMCFALASACALAVVRDTADGSERITSWPGLDFLDYLIEPLYLFNSLCVSVLPGAALSGLLVGGGLLGGLLTPAIAILLFPIVLLSMLESNSPLGAVSWPVLRTLGAACRGWAAFYLASAALLAATGAVAAIALGIGGLFGEFVAATTLTAAWFIYFRLLGRLAWYCADRMARDEPEEDEETVEEMHVQGVEMVPFTFVFCPRCANRVEIDRVPVGAEIRCDHCGQEFAVEYRSA